MNNPLYLLFLMIATHAYLSLADSNLNTLSTYDKEWLKKFLTTTTTEFDPSATTMSHAPTIPPRAYLVENCDNVAIYCFKAYTTGRICGRTTQNKDLNKRYQTFKNQCEMDFINCCEGFNVWFYAHMGACMEDKEYLPVKFFEYYEYWEDVFLDQVYVVPE